MRRLRLAIEASGEIIFTTDVNGTFTYVNPEFQRVYGYEPSDVLGRATPRILKGGTTALEDYATFWKRLKQSEVVRSEFVNCTKAGTLVNIETSANPVVDERGKLVGFLAVQRDITERKRLHAALAESEHRYRTLAEAAEDSIFIVNRARQIEYANEVTAARFGMSAADVIGRRLDDVFPGQTLKEMWRALSTVFGTGHRQLFEQSFDTQAGELWLETWLVPMFDSKGESSAVMGVARDVTQRKILERQFHQAQKMEAIGRLAGGIAHDFNNLLNTIIGYSELLEARFREAPDVVADLDEIKNAGKQANHLTRQLLTLGRKESATRQVQDVTAILAGLGRTLDRVLGADVQLTLLICSELWNVAAGPGQLEQVLLNLAINARDAMPTGGDLTISAANVLMPDNVVKEHSSLRSGPYVSLTIQDSGHGMTADVLAHVFEPFFTTKAADRGTGHGLSSVHGIVTQNGGSIAIDSRPGAGTLVTVRWPRSAVEPVECCSSDSTESVLAGTLLSSSNRVRRVAHEHAAAPIARGR
jgi:two-component system cell cycle sensor histidine kinase/response regulator CckA